MLAVAIKNLTKTYANGTEALKGINLEIQEGDFFAMLGANGAGKTTIISIITGLVVKSGGQVKIFDVDIDQDHETAKRMIGIAPQEFNFNIFEKVQDIVMTQAGYYGIIRQEALKESAEILKTLDLWDKRGVTARQLSGGMKRRLMIARALVHKPRLLILDEPTASVDVELRHGMWKYLHTLNDQGMTILLTTHYLEEVEQMCRHAAIIKEGKIIKNDSVKKLVGLLEQENYVITVKELKYLEQLKEYQVTVVDEHTLEVELDRKVELNAFLVKLTQAGIVMTDIRTKGFRLEKLFLNILKEKDIEAI